MQAADFQPLLQPRREGSQTFTASAVGSSTPETSSRTTSPSHGADGPGGGSLSMPLQRGRTNEPLERHDSSTSFCLEGPGYTEQPMRFQSEPVGSFRFGASPSSHLPAYQAGIVQSTGRALPPPPSMGAASPSASVSPGSFAGASFTIGTASPAICTPPRKASPDVHTPGGSRTPAAGDTPKTSRSSTKEDGNVSPGGRGRRSNGRSNSGSSRIDPEQVPRPVGQSEAVKEDGGKVYETNKYHVPPPASAVCTIVDKGSCSCEFVRSSVNQVPAYPSTANTAHVPITVVCQPFAELTAREEPIPIVDFGEAGPLRCTRCKAYVNPHFTWQANGREATCNFCGHHVEVPNTYMCSLDDKNRRRDHAERPELQRGTVDYVAPRDYDEHRPGVPAVAFVIETSQRSMQSGFFHQVMWTLRELLRFLKAPASNVAIITFGHALQFYAFYPGLEHARWITVADIEDPFVPCSPDALCIDVTDEAYASQVDSLLEQLPHLCTAECGDGAAGGAALKVACDLLGSRGGGHVIMFHASLPNTGVGALRPRDDLRLSAAPEGGGLFTPQQAPFFDAIAQDCLLRGVAVTVFCAPQVGMYIDIATLSAVPRRTGGDVHLVSGFDPSRDGEKLHYDIARTVVQGTVYSCIFKLRCSKGLAVDSMYATWEPEVIDQSTFHVSRMSVDATVVFVISHSERIEGQKYVYVQVACLHTDQKGLRLIRVHTLQLPVTTSLSNVFRYTEIDCVTNQLLKQAAAAALSGNASFKDKLAKSCVDMLHAYRINCASMTSAGQLILPESLKLLPLYVGAIRKMAAFRSGSDIRVDDRLAVLIRMLGLSIAQTAPLIYPRVYCLLPLPERAGLPSGVGDNVFMPPTMACSSDKLLPNRIYLHDNGSALRIYVREEVDLEALQRVFGVDNVADVPRAFFQSEGQLSEEAQRMWAIVQQIRRERIRLPWQPLSVVVPGTPEEPKLLANFCEDRVAGEMNYVDFLCHIHKLVQNKQE